MFNITNISQEIINVTLNPFAQCKIIEYNLDMSFYPYMLLAFLFYILLDTYYYKHVPRSKWKRIEKNVDLSDLQKGNNERKDSL